MSSLHPDPFNTIGKEIAVGSPELFVPELPNIGGGGDVKNQRKNTASSILVNAVSTLFVACDYSIDKQIYASLLIFESFAN
jgi:hypothetical protein